MRKFPVSPQETLKLIRSARKAYIKKGSKVLELDLTSKKIPQEELLGHFLGRSNTLRAPVMRVGEVLWVGFDEQGYRSLLK